MNTDLQTTKPPSCDPHFNPAPNSDTASTTAVSHPPHPLSLAHALRLKAAEYWLGLGEGKEALRELDRLPTAVGSHARVVKARVAAHGLLRQRNGCVTPQ